MMPDRNIEVGEIVRYRENLQSLWRVMRFTPKSVYLCRCDGSGNVTSPAEWLFRMKTFVRDFFPA